jgi:hypothetical protein
MSKYDNLRNFLLIGKESEIILSFAQIEELINGRLPKSAYSHAPWWNSSGSHSHAQTWEQSGYKAVEVSGMQKQEKMKFRRK